MTSTRSKASERSSRASTYTALAVLAAAAADSRIRCAARLGWRYAEYPCRTRRMDAALPALRAEMTPLHSIAGQATR
ncbi:hypothetical protein AB0C65_35635 [Nocardia sp. NPDC048505]|uniref:hypothetical protein n=1 Tax=Nocardia sp. NPDC048505 TaxID=3155756 RepID=UPI0033CF2B03